MTRRGSFWSLGLCCTILLLAPAVLTAGPRKQPSRQPPMHGLDTPTKDSTPPQADNSGYVGARSLQDLPRRDLQRLGEDAALEDDLDTKRRPRHQGCEGCHGPGAAHVAGGGDATKFCLQRSLDQGN